MSTLGFLNVGGKKYSLKYGESYVIGFMSDDYAHDIEINDRSVDIRHCIMDFTETIPKIFDIKSKCGTFVDHERIPSCCMFPLKKSTNIQIGDVDAIFQLAAEGDSGYLEERLTHTVNDNIPERDNPTNRSARRIKTAESRATNPSIDVSRSEHQFLVPTELPGASIKSRGSSTTNESFDSFSIPETQLPTKCGPTQADDNEDSFYIPETQDVVSADAILCNYPRVAFENEEVNETIGDCDKIPSSQFRICTQDFNGSDDEQSNHSDDILANVPCSLVIPTIRHSPVQINDPSRRGDRFQEIEKELSGLQWTKKSQQITNNNSVPDGICTPDNLVLPNDEQIEPTSACSTPDIFSDQDPLWSEINKSLKENDPPTIVVGYIKQSQVILRSPFKNVAPAPFEQNQDKSPLPPTQIFFPQPPKTKHSAINEKRKPTNINDDDLPPTQVFQPVPSKSKTNAENVCLSSTLVDFGMQPSESSFKAKCNRLLDSDDDEMDALVAPDLVNKYKQSLKTVKHNDKTPSNASANSHATPAKDNGNASQDKKKMLPPKNIPVHAAKSNAVASAEKQKTKNSDGEYVNIEMFLCTPDFMGKEFAKDENLQKKAEQSWKNQRKSLFKSEATPTKPPKNESDDSQDSFIDLIPHKKKQEENLDDKLRYKAPKELTPEHQSKSKQPTIETEGRITRRRHSTMIKETATKEKKVLNFKSNSDSKVDDVKKSRKQIRVKRAAALSRARVESVGDKNDPSPKGKKSKELHAESKSNHEKKHAEASKSNNSMNSLEVSAEKALAKEEDVKEVAKDKTRHKSNSLSDNQSPVGKFPKSWSLRSPSRNYDDTFNSSNVSVENSKSTTSSEDILPIGHKWTERRILEVVLNKNGARRYRAGSMKSSTTIGSDHLSRTRSKTKSSDVSVPSRVSFNTSSDERSNIRKTPRKRSSTTSNEEKKLSSAEKDKSKAKNGPEEVANGCQNVANAETAKVKKQTVLNKIVEEEGDKPQKRVTRLASAKQAEVAPATDPPTEPKPLKTSRATRGRPENPKEGKSKPDTADSAELEQQDRTNSQITSGGIKRKNCEDEIEPKRSRSTSSESIQLTQVKPKPKLRIAMTMCDPRYQEILEKHSGTLWVYTKDPKECDVLILEKGNRTYKLMVAIARGIPVVKLDWLVEVLKRKSTNVPTEEYIFQDRQFQERHQFLMKKSLFLANASPLFKGISFMMTPNIRPTPNEMEDIVTCAGGTVLQQVPKLKQRIFLISQSKDNQYWHQYRRANSNLKIVTTEGVMASVMQQSEIPLFKSIIQ